MNYEALIFQMLQGEAGAEELSTLNNWIAMSEANKSEFEALKLYWLGMQLEAVPPEQSDALYKKIDGQIGKRKRRRWLIFHLKSLVLMLLPTALVIFWGSHHATEKSGSDFLEFRNASVSEVTEVMALNFDLVIEVKVMEPDDWRFTGSFYNSRSGVDILASISSATNLTLNQVGKGRYELTVRK